jgi:hypothetical protein
VFQTSLDLHVFVNLTSLTLTIFLLDPPNGLVEFPCFLFFIPTFLSTFLFPLSSFFHPFSLSFLLVLFGSFLFAFLFLLLLVFVSLPPASSFRLFLLSFLTQSNFFPVKSLLQYSATSSTLQATFVESTCEQKLLPYICGSAFTRCDDKTAPGQVLARPLCRSVCEDVVEACSDFFQEENLALPNCSQVVESSANVKLSNGDEVEVKCFTVDSDLPAPKFPFECGGILDDDPNAEPFPCGG